MELFKQGLKGGKVRRVHGDKFAGTPASPSLGTKPGEYVLIQRELEWYAIRKRDCRRPFQYRRAIADGCRNMHLPSLNGQRVLPGMDIKPKSLAHRGPVTGRVLQ